MCVMGLLWGLKSLIHASKLEKCPVHRNLLVNISHRCCCCYKLYKTVLHLLQKILLLTNNLTTNYWSDENACLFF